MTVLILENSKCDNCMKSIMIANIFVALFQVLQIVINILQNTLLCKNKLVGVNPYITGYFILYNIL